MAKQKQISLNGATAYREGAALDDNPFNKSTQPGLWIEWREGWHRAQDHFVGKN